MAYKPGQIFGHCGNVGVDLLLGDEVADQAWDIYVAHKRLIGHEGRAAPLAKLRLVALPLRKTVSRLYGGVFKGPGGYGDLESLPGQLTSQIVNIGNLSPGIRSAGWKCGAGIPVRGDQKHMGHLGLDKLGV